MIPLPSLSVRTWFEIGLGLLLVAALVTVGLERDRHSRTRIAFADFKAKTAQQEQQRERVAREDAHEVSRLQARHATRQQEIVHVFYQSQLEQERRQSRRASDDRGVFNFAAAYAARRGREAAGDSDSCRLAKAGLREITGLLAEGHELAGEGASLVEQRDAELRLWIDLGTNDRALTQPSR